MKDKAQVRTKMIISTSVNYHQRLAPCYDFALSYNAFIMSRIVITYKSYHSECIGPVIVLIIITLTL
jgi:hypothetical protein